ncbi:transcriptional regulator [Candidatus Gottesmanbacteria bacterium RIFCSPHIGHO2_02_FULL_39_11]|uniref:Transcriptional regulator n=1 Tax=Candidatus Gottesmanbacteria bacterium RIFCSPHIGHO2_02_FULL_39_11 TaxID=1798382 RepID=A0A1F5ZUN6_9BACT|nr:MAG: transcriptional regulator [Candidatus Gottesmanbacteria bacterium RIFCSPHIGHO2_02_FULL_39_11]
MKLCTFDDHKKELLKDPEFKKEYDRLEPEFALVRSLIRSRIKRKLTQAQLAKKIGSKQAVISRLESGNANPTIGFLKKISEALNLPLHIQIG